MSRVDPLLDFTPGRWEAARRVLSGEDDARISVASAARAAGVSVTVLKGWMRRAQERRPGDDPLLGAIADFSEEIKVLQAGRLEDAAWERAVVGVEKAVWYRGEKVGVERVPDNKLLKDMLVRRDPSYQPQMKNVHQVDVTLRSDEIFRRLLAGSRLAAADAEAKAIEGDGSVDMEEVGETGEYVPRLLGDTEL